MQPIPCLAGFYADSAGDIWYTLDGHLIRRRKWLNRVNNRWTIYATKGRGQGRPLLVAPLVLEAFAGPRPFPLAVCCHNNGDSSDDRPENLRWDTNRGNSADAVRHGRYAGTVLNAELARRIVALHRSGLSVVVIGVMLGVRPSTVYLAATGRTWNRATGLPKPPPPPCL